MSRFGDYDGETQWNGGDLWTHRAYLALHGKKGRAALVELREALLALPEKRLIEGALCTVGIRERLAAMPETIEREITPFRRGPDGKLERGPDGLPIQESPRIEPVHNYERDEIIDLIEANVEEQGEGVCAIGAYVWYQKVKAGMDPAAAFAAVEIGGDEYATTDAGKAAGLTFTLAWELANRNDELMAGLTPEQRYVAFLGFIDKTLAAPPLQRPAPKPKRETPSPASASLWGDS